jgi:hypothetical protein
VLGGHGYGSYGDGSLLKFLQDYFRRSYMALFFHFSKFSLGANINTLGGIDWISWDFVKKFSSLL